MTYTLEGLLDCVIENVDLFSGPDPYEVFSPEPKQVARLQIKTEGSTVHATFYGQLPRTYLGKDVRFTQHISVDEDGINTTKQQIICGEDSREGYIKYKKIQ